MSRIVLRAGLGAVLAAGALATAPAVGRAQFVPGGYPAFNPYANLVQQQVIAQQQAARVANLAAFQQAVTARAFNNPFAANAFNNPLAGPAGNLYTPQLGGGTNVYTPGLGADPTGAAGGLNQYNPYLGVGGYGQGGLYGPVGGTLVGAADLLRGYGTALTSQEAARKMREEANQAKLQTIKNKFDLDMYIRANTPTFTDEQLKTARNTLKRIQNNASPAEVTSGRALNVLLDDVRKSGKKVALDPVPLDADVLHHVNVHGANGSGSLGALRDGGKINWPLGLEDVLTPEQRRAMEAQAQALMRDAGRGRPDANTLRDFRNEVGAAMDHLLRKANDLPTAQYLNAKRFLSDLDDAQAALGSGQAQAQLDFQSFARGGKTVQDLVQYMTEKGLTFAPASLTDEAAYRAVYSALVAYNLAFHHQVASAPGAAAESKE